MPCKRWPPCPTPRQSTIDGCPTAPGAGHSAVPPKAGEDDRKTSTAPGRGRPGQVALTSPPDFRPAPPPPPARSRCQAGIPRGCAGDGSCCAPDSVAQAVRRVSARFSRVARGGHLTVCRYLVDVDPRLWFGGDPRIPQVRFASWGSRCLPRWPRTVLVRLENRDPSAQRRKRADKLPSGSDSGQ